MPEKELGELKVLIQELKSEIHSMDSKQDEMMADIKSIKDVVYNPENGLYARVRDLEQWKTGLNDYDKTKTSVRDLKVWKDSIKDYETVKEDVRDLKMAKEAVKDYEDVKDDVRDLTNWKEGLSKFMWAFGLSIAGLVAKTFVDMI
jgi:chromosome segregation ATPase